MLATFVTLLEMKVGKKGNVKKEKIKTVSIPAQLFEKIEERIKVMDFASVSSFVTYVLEEILVENEEVETLTKKEGEEQIKARLKALGYIE